jgi:hypothetical protein
MLDRDLVFERKAFIVDNLVIVGPASIKGYTTKKGLKSQFIKLSEAFIGGTR